MKQLYSTQRRTRLLLLSLLASLGTLSTLTAGSAEHGGNDRRARTTEAAEEIMIGSPAEENDSLSRYLEVAGRNNPALNARFLAYKASLEKVNRAGTWSDPELEIGFFLKPMEIVGGRQVADITLMQMFPWFGTKQTARTEATHRTRMAYEEFRDARDELFLEVYTQWYLLGRLQDQLAYYQESKELLHLLEQLTTGQVSARSPGSGGGMTNLLRVQLETAEIENNIESLHSEIKAEKAKFNALLNRPVDSEVLLPDSIVKVPFRVTMADATRTIEEQNPLLRVWQEEEKAYEAKEKMEKKMGYPMMGVGVQYMMVTKSPTPVVEHHNGMHMVMPMVSVSLPLFRNKYRSAQRESRILRQSAQAKYNSTLNDLQSDLYGLKHRLDDAERKVTLYRKQKELALTAYRLLIQEFVAGKSDLLGVLEVQRQLLDYRLQEAEAIADYNTMVASIQKLHSFNSSNE